MAVNHYLKRQQAMMDAATQIAERVTRQFDLDSWQIALARYPKLDLGYQRIMEITALAEQVRAEYAGAIEHGPETDVCRHHMDRELEQIMGREADRLIPFEDRYPELRAVKYDRGRR